MGEKTTYRNDTYFAAANGYKGFKSYFSEVFESSDFARIFVLKGGPGTGKSTLMRRIKAHFSGKAHTESILCSSDIGSLDGIIVRRGDTKCAVLDGTAPHERDAVIPGAIDDIVNLGEGWNGDALRNQRSTVLELCRKKKYFYSLAYKMLSLAGSVNESLRELITPYIRMDLVAAQAEEIFDPRYVAEGKKARVKLYSCFGKGGYQRISPEGATPTVIRKGHASTALISAVMEKYRQEMGIDILIPSPLDASVSEGFCVNDKFFIEGDEEGAIDTTHLTDPLSDKISELEKELEATLNKHLHSAKQFFALASEEHFRLEKIYSECMDFSASARECDMIATDFSKILKI